MISCPFVLAASLVLSTAAVEAQPPSPPTIDWREMFSSVSVSGAEYSPGVTALQGKRVRLRGWAVVEPVPPGGLFLTRVPSERLHPDDEETLPWESAVVVWKAGISVPPVPARPTVEGTLRLGNRRIGAETVILTLEDAVPVVGLAVSGNPSN